MNKEVAHILKERIAAGGGVPFVEVIAGLAQRVEFKQPNGDGVPVLKRMPVSYDTTAAQGCKVTPETALVPNSKKKGLLYFEDMGSAFVDRVSGGHIKYRSTLVLVCWMNRARLVGDHYKEITSYCVTQLLSKLKAREISNEGNFARFYVTPGRILPQDASVFSRYTYEEAVTQYLRPPFEFFGMELTVEFTVHPACVEQLEFKDPVCY